MSQPDIENTDRLPALSIPFAEDGHAVTQVLPRAVGGFEGGGPATAQVLPRRALPEVDAPAATTVLPALGSVDAEAPPVTMVLPKLGIAAEDGPGATTLMPALGTGAEADAAGATQVLPAGGVRYAEDFGATMVLSAEEALPQADEPRADVLLAERAALARALRSAGEEREALSRALAAADQERALLSHALAAAEQEREELGAELNARDAELADLRRSLEGSRAAGAALNAELTTLRTELRSVRGEAGGRTVRPNADAEARRDAGALARIGREINEVRVRAARYFEMLQSLEWRRGVHAEIVRGLEDELAAARAECRALAAELGGGRPAAAPRPVPAAGGTAPAEAGGLEAERSARAAAERERDALRAASAQQQARIAELETFGVGLGRALQSQTNAAHAATAKIDTLELALHKLKMRVLQLESELAAQRLGGTAGAAGDEAERAARERDEQLRRASAELEALRAAHHELGVLLERTRGALEERNLQIRRLERSSARRPAPAAEDQPLNAGLLLPLDGSAPRPINYGRRTTVGRAPDSDLCIDHTSVSRHHAVLIAGPTGTFIEDLKSVNGVGVNGRRVRHARLVDGDLVALGTVRFRFAAQDPAPRDG